MRVTAQEVQAVIETVKAVNDAIKELGTIPSGLLYAHLMGVMDIHTYNRIIELLQRAGTIKVRNHLITYCG